MPVLNFMPHQQQALDQTESFNRCAYYLDMGLGKTFVGAEKMYLLNNDVNLVVCQKSKIDDWLDHFEKYYPDYEVFNLTKKTQAVRFRELIDTSAIYDYKKQIEIKAPRGEPSELQLYHLENIRKAGGRGILLYPKDFDNFKEFVADTEKGNSWYLDNIEFQDQWKEKLRKRG